MMKKQRLVNELMSARRAIGVAKRAGEDIDLAAARATVDAAKIGLANGGQSGGTTRAGL